MPSEFVFEPRSPRYGPFLVSGCWCTLQRFWGFLAPWSAVSRTYRGVRGHQRSLGHEKVQRHVQCTSRLPSLGCFAPSLGLFLGEKWLFLTQNCADLGGHPPSWRHRPWPPPVTWIWQGHYLSFRMARVRSGPRRLEGAIAKTARRRVVACCCLLAKFKGRGV